MQGETRQKNRITQLTTVVCLLIPGLVILMIWWRCGIYFETNDDRTIAEILSGILAPGPDWHTAHVNVILSLPLSLLYRITSKMPWYGICLLFFHGVMYFILMKGLFKKCRHFCEYIAAVFLSVCVFLLDIGMLAQIQYTSTAALLACFGYAALLLWEGEQKAWGIFFFLELMACLLRDQAMLMIQPLGMTVYAGLQIVEKDSPGKQKIKKIVLACGIVFGIWIVSYAARAIAYQEPEWNEYLVRNSAREKIFDYGDKPSYGEAETILEQYGVTEIQYNAFMSNTIMEGELSARCVADLAEYCNANRERSVSLLNCASEAIRQYWTGEYRRMNRVTLLLWLSFGVWCIVTWQLRAVIPGIFLFIGRTLVWAILLYRGRMPDRVTLPLFFSEILLLLLLIWKSRTQQEGILTVVTALVILLTFGGAAFFCGQVQYRYAVNQNRGQRTLFTGMNELQSYCAQHPERQYYVETMSLAYYAGSAFETEIYRERDFLPTGGWYASSPAMNKRITQFREEREKGIYLVIYEDGNQRNHPAVLYFEEKTASEPVEVDDFTLSHGGSYKVYFFEE